MKRVKSVSNRTQRMARSNGHAASSPDPRAMEAIDELHVAFITRTDMLMRAVSDLSAVIIQMCKSTGHTPSIHKMQFADYEELKQEFKEAVNSILPASAVVAVVSKGDDELLDLHGRVAHHFPRAADGRYAGYHPANSADAVRQLEAARADGMQYLVFPRATYWWLDYYSGLKRYLAKHCRCVSSPIDVCRIYSFGEHTSVNAPLPAATPESRPYLSYPGNQIYLKKIREAVKRTLPLDAVVAVVSKGDAKLLNLDGRVAHHFTQDTNGRSTSTQPVNDAAAVRQLERHRSKGAQYLLLPGTAFWWLEFYPRFKIHLEKECRLVAAEERVCMIWDICASGAKPTQPRSRAGNSTGKRPGVR